MGPEINWASFLVKSVMAARGKPQLATGLRTRYGLSKQASEFPRDEAGRTPRSGSTGSICALQATCPGSVERVNQRVVLEADQL